MNFKELSEKINWKYVALIVSIIILIIILYFYYRSKKHPNMGMMEGEHHTNITEGMDTNLTESESESETESAAPNKVSRETVEPDGEIVLYYATWCGYSRMFLPEWEKFEKYAKDNLSNLKVTRIRCEGGNEAVCTQKGVEGYPTIILYLKNSKEVKFDGERSSKQLADFIRKYL